MENLSKRTILILAAIFLMMNFGWFIGLKSMHHQPAAVHCSYGPNVTCTPVAG